MVLQDTSVQCKSKSRKKDSRKYDILPLRRYQQNAFLKFNDSQGETIGMPVTTKINPKVLSVFYDRFQVKLVII